MKALQDLEQKEKSLKDKVESISKKEAGATSKAIDLDSQLQKQLEENERLHQQMVAQLKSVETQRDEAIEQKQAALKALEEATGHVQDFKRKVTDTEGEQ